MQGVRSFNCDLFSGAVSVSDYVAPNDKVISEWWIENDMEEGCHGLVCDTIVDLLGGTEEEAKISASRVSRW